MYLCALEVVVYVYASVRICLWLHVPMLVTLLRVCVSLYEDMCGPYIHRLL